MPVAMNIAVSATRPKHSRRIADNVDDLPDWATGLAVNSWKEISGSAMSNMTLTVNPGSKNPANIIAAWGSACVDTRTSDLWMIALGGHSDYYGNQVLRQRLSNNVPVWEERFESSPLSAVTISSARYTDNMPASSHGYWGHQFIEARNRAMRFQASATATNGDSFAVVEAFDSTVEQGVNGWDPVGTIPNIPGITSSVSVTIKNPTTEDVYFFRVNSAVYKWTQATNTWSTVASNLPVTFSESTPAFDSSRSRILLYKRAGTDFPTAREQLYTFNVLTNTATARTFSGDSTAIAALHAADKGVGMVYDPVMDAYLVRLKGAGAAVYKITADDTFTVSELSTTGGALVPAAAIANGTENIYGRWLYVSDIGNGIGGVAYIPIYTANTWFLRTH